MLRMGIESLLEMALSEDFDNFMSSVSVKENRDNMNRPNKKP